MSLPCNHPPIRLKGRLKLKAGRCKSAFISGFCEGPKDQAQRNVVDSLVVPQQQQPEVSRHRALFFLWFSLNQKGSTVLRDLRKSSLISTEGLANAAFEGGVRPLHLVAAGGGTLRDPDRLTTARAQHLGDDSGTWDAKIEAMQSRQRNSAAVGLQKLHDILALRVRCATHQLVFKDARALTG